MSLEDEITAAAERQVSLIERDEVLGLLRSLEWGMDGKSRGRIEQALEAEQAAARGVRVQDAKDRLYRHIISAGVESYNNSLEGQIRRGGE